MVSHLATLLVGFTTSIVISHVGAQELGRWRFAQAIVMYLIVATDAGLSMLAVREVARSRTDLDRYAGPLLVIRLLLASVALTTSILIIGPGSNADAGWFYVAMILTIVPAALSLAHIVQGLEKMRTYALVRFVSGGLASSIGLVAFVLTHNLITLVIPVIVVGLIVDLGLVVYLRAIVAFDFRIGTPRLWMELLLPALPFLVGALCIQLISNVDAVIIGTSLGERELGIYAAAYVLAGQFLLLSGPISWAMYPRLATLHEEGAGFDRAVRELSGVLGLFVLPACVGAILVAPSLIVGIYGREYQRSIPLLAILMGMPLIGFYNGAMGQALNAARLHATVARVAALAAGVSVLLNIALVPTLGLTAAAVTTVVTEIVAAGVYTWVMRPMSGFAPVRAYFATIDAVVVMSVVLIALPDLALPLTVLVGIAAYSAVVLLRRPASVATLQRMIGRGPFELG
jgi:O-antigen/teichoic acid export membrane protein